jgi:hypothetical protein
MNAPLEPAHSRFGGSVAARVLHCPASVGAVAKVPPHLRKSSAYADRGSALHATMVLLIDEKEKLENLTGKTVGNYTITGDDIENALRPVFAYVTELLDTPGSEYYLEYRITFPTIPGAFGTCDLLVRIGSTVFVIDFKFGSGVRILALYPEGDEDALNAQLLYYACGARHSLPEFFAGVENIGLVIVQPQSAEPDAEMISAAWVTDTELDEFVIAYRAACEEAQSETPRLQRGTHCKFCPARPACPEHVKPLLDLAQFAVPTPPPGKSKFAAPAAFKQPATEAYLKALADGLNLVDAIKDIRVALHDQAKAALEHGDAVPGYVLTTGRAERHWRDNDRTTAAALEKLGFAHGGVVSEELRSPRQIELRAKARGLKLQKEIQELVVSTRSGTSLMRAENAHAPMPGRGELMRSFSAALKAFQEGKV